VKPQTLFQAIIILSLISAAPRPDFEAFSSRFVRDYKQLHIPGLELNYVDGLRKIKSANSIREQLAWFRSIQARLPEYQPAALNPAQKTDYALIAYETSMNLQRLALEEQWAAHPPDTISAAGIYTVPNGKAWYAYLLKRWVGDEVTPDQIYQFGLAEVARVSKRLADIRRQCSMSEDDPSFFIKDPGEVQRAFERVRGVIDSNLSRLFSITRVPDLRIAKGASQALAQTPGYYDNNTRTFYYNLFDKPYNKRQIDWLYIHEGIPGHHYQISLASAIDGAPLRQLFFYSGFAEGWGAYAEELGKDLGVYQTPYDELGKWEWDIVRSVRVPLDVGLNYYGWTDRQALDFWKANIRGQDDIALREIARMRRWPAQVVTYKYGALQIMHWKEALQKRQGNAFNIKDFHDRVLNGGTLPLFLARERVLMEPDKTASGSENPLPGAGPSK